MSTFQFNTSGHVWVELSNVGGERERARYRWHHLNDFQRGYFTAMAREAWEGLDQNQKDRLDHFGPIAFSDFAPETLARGMRDCEARCRLPPPIPRGSEFGEEFWGDRQGGQEIAFPTLRLVIAEDGLLHAEERR